MVLLMTLVDSRILCLDFVIYPLGQMLSILKYLDIP